MKSPAEDYFKNTKQYSDIKRFITTRTREGVYLDFKTNRNSKHLDEFIKTTLSKAASGSLKTNIL